MQVMFVVGLEGTLRPFDTGMPRGATRVGLQGDETFVGSARWLAQHFGELETLLAVAGHRLRRHKCGVWAPGYDGADNHELPAGLAHLTSLIPRKSNRIELLVSDANSAYTTHAALLPEVSEHAAERARVAAQTVEAAVRLAHAQVDMKSYAKAWALLQKSAAHAMDFDLRLTPPDAIAGGLEQQSEAMKDALGQMLGKPLTDFCWARAALHGHLGGPAWRSAGPLAPAHAAYWASYDLHSAVVPGLLEAPGRPASQPHLEAAHALRSRAALAAAGVAVEARASVELTGRAQRAYESTPWRVDTPTEMLCKARPLPEEQRQAPPSATRQADYYKLLSRLCAGLEATEVARPWTAAGQADAIGMLSSRGPGTGATWAGTHRSPHELLPNAHWRIAIANRVGLDVTPPSATCQLAASTSRAGDVCGRALAATPHHPEGCKKGAAHMSPHRNLAATLAALVRRAGAVADIERYVPELYD